MGKRGVEKDRWDSTQTQDCTWIKQRMGLIMNCAINSFCFTFTHVSGIILS